jgi:hypothetical protein
VSAAAARASVAGTDHDHVAILVQAEQLRQGQVETGRDLLSDRQRRVGVPPFDLGQHRGADAAALRQVPQGQVHGLAQAFDAGAHGSFPSDRCAGDLS